MGRAIDLKTWKRREHFRLYRRFRHPFFSVCVDVDATPVWTHCQTTGAPSFFLTSLFLMLKAANHTEAFRLRLRTRGVWLHDRVAVGPTILKSDETFAFCRIEFNDSLKAFIDEGKKAVERSKSRKTLAPANEKDDDIVFHSTLPWIRFTSFTNALRGGDDSVPRVVFGRCTRDGNAFRMPVGVEVHHALVDGLDVARFIERFQAQLSDFQHA